MKIHLTDKHLDKISRILVALAPRRGLQHDVVWAALDIGLSALAEDPALVIGTMNGAFGRDHAGARGVRLSSHCTDPE